MRAAQQIDGHILDSICSFDRHQGFWGIALFTISAGLYVMKYVWFIISAVQSIYEVGSGKFGGELTNLHSGLQDPLLPLKNALMLKNMGGRGGGRGGGSGATRGKNGILRAQAGAGGRG